jgi:hypothetical protein
MGIAHVRRKERKGWAIKIHHTISTSNNFNVILSLIQNNSRFDDAFKEIHFTAAAFDGI